MVSYASPRGRTRDAIFMHFSVKITNIWSTSSNRGSLLVVILHPHHQLKTRPQVKVHWKGEERFHFGGLEICRYPRLVLESKMPMAKARKAACSLQTKTMMTWRTTVRFRCLSRVLDDVLEIERCCKERHPPCDHCFVAKFTSCKSCCDTCSWQVST